MSLMNLHAVEASIYNNSAGSMFVDWDRDRKVQAKQKYNHPITEVFRKGLCFYI